MFCIATFNYTALDKAGKDQKGSMEAESREKAVDELKKKGLLPVKITEQGALSKDINIGFLNKKPKPRDLSVFCHQFVSILDAGVPVINALDMLGKQTDNKMLSAATDDTRRSIERGETLADSMRRNQKVFGSLLITLVEAGEASGTLSNSFQRMAIQFERSAKVKAMIKKATIYPAVIGIVALVMVVVMLTVVLPSFQGVFDSMGTELPGITLMLINLSDYMINNYLFLLAVVVAIVVALILFRKSDMGQRVFGMLAKTLPITKNFSVKSGSASMARTLSTLFSSGLSLIDSLEITARTLKNVHFRDAISAVRDDVAVGITMSESLERTKMFPPMVHQMINIGEETGNIESMLDKMASYYEEETEAASLALAAMMEPMIIVVMAVIVGTLVIAMLAPMGAMYSAMDTM